MSAIWDTTSSGDKVLQAVVGMHITADGLNYFPKDSPKLVTTSGTTVTTVATYAGIHYVQILTGVGTSSISDSGWEKQ